MPINSSRLATEGYLRNKRESAAYLGISVQSLERLMRGRLLPYIKITSGQGAVRFHIDDLNRFIEAHRVNGSGGPE